MTFLDPLFYLYFFYFCITLFFAFFIPGDLLVYGLKRPVIQRIVLSTILGMVLWAIQGYLFGYLQLRFLTYIYLFVAVVYWLKYIYQPRPQFIKNITQSYKHLDVVLIGIFIVGVAIQFVSVGFNGITLQNGLIFCCAVPDSIYHVSLVYELTKNLPPYEPGIYDVVVKNYHYLGNLVVAELVRVFHLPLLYTQNQYITLFLSLCIGLSAVVFGQIVRLKKTYIRWFVFFLYFYGDIIFFISFLLGNGFIFSYSLQENAGTLWISPPRVFAIVIFLAGLSFFSLWIEKKSYLLGMLMAICFGVLIGFKVYIGIFALSGFFLLGCYFLYKRNIKMLIPIAVSFLITLVLYLPTNSGSGGLYFVGLWRLEDFIVNPAFDLSRLELARRIYIEHNNFLRVAQYEIMYLLLYIPSIFGIYLLGFFQTKKSLGILPSFVHVYLLTGGFVSLMLGTFFFQTVGGANTSQFLLPLYIVGALYTAITCAFSLQKVPFPIRIIGILVICVLTSTRVLHTTYTTYLYITRIQPVVIDKNEQDVLHFLKTKTHPDAIVLLGNKKMVLSNNSYYINFIGHRPLFLAGNGILTDHGVNTEKRVKEVDAMLLGRNAVAVAKAFERNNISYVYLFKGDKLVSTDSAKFLRPVIKNSKITLLQFDKALANTYIESKK